MTPGSQPIAHLIISNTGVLCIGEISQTESKMLLIKHKWGLFRNVPVFFHWAGRELQVTQVEKDVVLEPFLTPITKSLFDQPLNFVVETFEWLIG